MWERPGTEGDVTQRAVNRRTGPVTRLDYRAVHRHREQRERERDIECPLEPEKQ